MLLLDAKRGEEQGGDSKVTIANNCLKLYLLTLLHHLLVLHAPRKSAALVTAFLPIKQVCALNMA